MVAVWTDFFLLGKSKFCYINLFNRFCICAFEKFKILLFGSFGLFQKPSFFVVLSNTLSIILFLSSANLLLLFTSASNTPWNSTKEADNCEFTTNVARNCPLILMCYCSKETQKEQWIKINSCFARKLDPIAVEHRSRSTH